MSLLLLSACGLGTISSTTASDPLETAFYLTVDHPDTPTMLLALSNSYIASCKAPELTGDNEEALLEFYMAASREGSQVALVDLRSYGVDTWEGVYPVADRDFQPNDLSGQRPFIAQGAYLHVREAELDDEEGLERSYRVTDAVWAPEVAAPGQVSISSWEPDGVLVGQLSFESLDVSARFRAVPCDVSYDDSIFPYTDQLALLFEEQDPQEN